MSWSDGRTNPAFVSALWSSAVMQASQWYQLDSPSPKWPILWTLNPSIPYHSTGCVYHIFEIIEIGWFLRSYCKKYKKLSWCWEICATPYHPDGWKVLASASLPYRHIVCGGINVSAGRMVVQHCHCSSGVTRVFGARGRSNEVRPLVTWV